MDVKISVAIPAYNAEWCIKSALESVINQTCKPYELIIVNNGSTDNTLSIVESFKADHKSENIQIFSQENLGISGSRNRAIKEAEGEYISFLDADDVWYETKLDEVNKIISKSPQTDIIWHNEMRVFTSTNRKTPLVYRIPEEPFYQDVLFNGNCFSTSAVTVKLEKIRAIGGFYMDKKRGEEDYDCWLRLMRNNVKLYKIPICLGEYRISGKGTSSNFLSHIDAVYTMELEHLNYMLENEIINKPEYKKMHNIFERNKYYSIAREFSKAKDLKESLSYYKKAISKSPLWYKNYMGIALSFVEKVF